MSLTAEEQARQLAAYWFRLREAPGVQHPSRGPARPDVSRMGPSHMKRMCRSRPGPAGST